MCSIYGYNSVRLTCMLWKTVVPMLASGGASVVDCGWLPCPGELPALSAGGESQSVSQLGHARAVVLDFENKNFVFPSVRTPQGRSSLNVS